MLLTLPGLFMAPCLQLNPFIHLEPRHQTQNLPLDSPKLTISWVTQILKKPDFGLVVPWVSAPSNYPPDRGWPWSPTSSRTTTLGKECPNCSPASFFCSSNTWGILGQYAHTEGRDRPGTWASACRSSLPRVPAWPPAAYRLTSSASSALLWVGLTCACLFESLPLLPLTLLPSSLCLSLLLLVFSTHTLTRQSETFTLFKLKWIIS